MRRCFPLAWLGCLSAAALLLTPALASADTSSTLTVVGTSDVSDSGLIPNLIQPEFQSAFPQYQLKYIGTATGTAISDAETGSVGASALIVHAPSLENQFVANGFSSEQYGRALFTNDFVLGGPSGDPAGVAANAGNNIAQAFADVAAAGVNGQATFVSRGGTPGTTVEEHQIWGLVQNAGMAPAGLLLCAVNATNGGGETPIAAGNGVTASGQPCPGGGVLPTGAALPPWYVATGLTQGPNVVAANACNGFPSGANTCYVLTDRGTFDYLASGTDPAGSIPALKIVTRGPQSASAPGGVNALINYFHGYIINPSKPGQSINLPAAQAFLNFITSPAVQAQLSGYLAHTSDPAGPPFVADASPIITASRLPGDYHAGKKLTVTGTVANAQPGYPAPAGKPVSVDLVQGGLAVPVASTTTKSSGAYSIRFAPAATGSYEVATPQIAQIEDSTLNPAFGDLLSPGATSPARITVHAAVTGLRVKSTGARALVIGSVAPGTGHVKATVEVLARRNGSKGAFKQIATDRLAANDGNFAIAVALKTNRWQIKVRAQDPKQVVSTTSKTITAGVTATRPPAGVTVRSLSVSKSAGLTLTAGVKPSTSSGKVQLLAMNTSAGKAARFGVFATATLRRGKATLRARLRHGNRYIFQLQYVNRGQTTSFSGLRTTNVR